MRSETGIVHNEHKCNDLKITKIYYDHKKDRCLMDVPFIQDMDDLKYTDIQYTTIVIEYCPYCGEYLGNNNIKV